ncbi:MAG: hypothetical protein AMXMBFR33_54280 [Candidatus Xenobia bacterium]
MKRLLILGLLPWPLVGAALYGFHQYWLALLAYHTLCLGAYALWGQGRVRLDRHLVWYLLAALVFLLPAVKTVGLFVQPALILSVLTGFGFQSWHLPLLIAYFLLVHPFAEEAFWRATLYQGLRQETTPGRAAVLSSLLFGAWHALVLVPLLPSMWWLGTLAVIFFGLAMAALYEQRRQALMPCTLLHALGGDLPLLVILTGVVLGS